LTFYLPGYFRRNKNLPKVVTLYDMIPERTNQKGRLWNPHFAKRGFLKKAQAVISISNTSTTDMVSEFGIEKSVTTTYLGVSSNFSPDLPKLEGVPLSYFLYVGARGGYKDANTAIRALAKLTGVHQQTQLVFVGGGRLSSSEKALIDSLGVAGRVTQMTVPDADLPRLYSNAIGLAYTSLYEGFGLPLVEAMASGIAIIASDTAINREIAGTAANYYPAGDAAALADGIVSVLSDPSSQRTKIEEGLAKSVDFSWLECARQTAEVYRAVMQTRTANS
jgi:glycosyltransferase involved in cell wall biosynthesis